MLRYNVVKNIHERHQGISKCRERANSAVWWPGINQQLAEFVTKCPVCTKYRQINAEPMMLSNLPSYPWQKVGCDLFQFNNATYLLVVTIFLGISKSLFWEKTFHRRKRSITPGPYSHATESPRNYDLTMDHSFLQMF